MKTISDEQIILFLEAFFNLFDARIDNIVFNGRNVNGIIIWEDEDSKQEFLWNNLNNNSYYESATELLNYLIRYELIKGDMIIVSKDTLCNILKNSDWDSKKITNTIEFLCSVKIDRIENNEIIDYFFIHF